MELMAGRAGLASGLVLGLAFVTAAIGVPVTGAIADKIGLQAALGLQVAVVAVTVLIAMLLPSEQYLRQPARQPARAGGPAPARGACTGDRRVGPGPAGQLPGRWPIPAPWRGHSAGSLPRWQRVGSLAGSGRPAAGARALRCQACAGSRPRSAEVSARLARS